MLSKLGEPTANQPGGLNPTRFGESYEQTLIEDLARTLEGHLAIPDYPQRIVIFTHGSGSSRHSRRNRFAAKRLNESRLATLLFDLLTEEEHITIKRPAIFDSIPFNCLP